MLTISQWRSQENRGGSPDCNVPEVGGLPHPVLSPSPASLTITALTVCNILTDCLRCFHSNQLDKDRVWTFGSGPRMCVGHKFIHKIIKVSFYSWIPFAKVAYCVIANNSLLAIFRNGAGEEITKLNPCLWHFGAWVIYLAWENSQAMTGFPVEWRLSSDCRNSIPMTWTPPIWVRVVLLIGLAAREIYFNQSEALSHMWVMARHQYGISLLVPLTSFCMASRNVGCILWLRSLRSSKILVNRSGIGKTKQITWHGNEQCHCCSRSLLLLTPTTWFSLVRKRNRNAKSELESERDRR